MMSLGRSLRALPVLAALFFAAAGTPPARAAESAPVSSKRAVATLVTDTDIVAPGTPFRAALRLRLADGWHTYWRNPGDAGQAPELHFTTPDGWTAGDIAWPAPLRLPENDLMTFGFTGDLVLPVTIRPDHAGGKLRLNANWLVCAKICVPEEGDFSLDLRPGAPAPSAQAPLFAAADTATPRVSPWTSTITPNGTLTVAGDGLSPASVRDAWFMASRWGQIEPGARQHFQSDDGRIALGLTLDPDFRKRAAATPEAVPGVLVIVDTAGKPTAFDINATPGPAAPPSQPKSEGPTLWRLLGLAALGGLILNLMPCVFPVLAMKALGLARLDPEARGHARGYALSYTAGVVAAFVLVGAALLAVRAGGDAVGWGFQFQSPVFVAVIAWVLFAIGLNLAGVFEIGGSVAGLGQRSAERPGHTGSFLTGALAVVVATPCSAPFMGTAITSGLAASWPVALGVFVAMGLGLAAPYLLLAAVPGLARHLPRPGRWMVILKHALAFPIFAACVWLLWVASVQTGPDGVLAIGVGLIFLAFGAWTLGLAQSARGAGRRVATAATAASGIGVVAILFSIATAPAIAPTSNRQASAQRAGVPAHEPFSRTRLAELRRSGRPVFVNMTAAWCITCLVNERVALSPQSVRDAFAAHNVVYLKGDWTRRDTDITEFLRANDRDGVPLYVLYPSGGAPPQILPQILTTSTVLTALDRVVR